MTKAEQAAVQLTMDAAQAMLCPGSVQQLSQACTVCQKFLPNFRSVQRVRSDRPVQKTSVCSTTCEKLLVHIIQAFAQGFLISWVLCCFCDKPVRDLILDEQEDFKPGSSSTKSSVLMQLQEKEVSLSDNGDVELSPVPLDIDEFVTPVHFGTDSFHELSVGRQSGFSIDKPDVELLDKDIDKASTSSAPVSLKPRSVTSGEDASSCCSDSAARLLQKSETGKPVSLEESSGTTATRKVLLQDGKTSASKDVTNIQSVQEQNNMNPAKQMYSFSAEKSTRLFTRRKSSILEGHRNARHGTGANTASMCKKTPGNNCVHCCKVFSNKRLLKQHIKTCNLKRDSLREKGKQNFTCEYCAQSFMNRYSLKAHIRRMHSGEEAVECDICGKLQPGTFALRAHKKACHSFHSLCHICGAEFSGRTSFDKHMAGHGGVKRYFCDICGAGFVHNSSLNNHKTVHLTTKSFQCDICPQMFKVRHLLNKHLLKTHQCGPSLDHRIRGLRKMGVEVDKEAMARHAGHQCIVCGEGLVSGRCPAHPDNRQEVFHCPTCGDMTSSIVLFYQHVKWHKGILMSHNRRTSLCGDVPVGLLSSTSDSTSGETASLIKCEVCSKTFKNVEYLSAHMHQHREARFACDVCHKRFTYKCNLKTHMNTHLDTWQFECQTCQKRFRDKYAFKKHQLKHMEPQFKCQVCNKALTRRPYLIRHYQKMHPEFQQDMQQ